MQRTTYSLFTVAFAIGCFGLWLVLNLSESIYPLRTSGSLPGFTHYILANKLFLLAIPLPFLVFSPVFLFKRKPTPEINLFYLGILVVMYSILFLIVTVAVLLPWIPIIEKMK